jgi:Flp pilus assembly protein TadD
MQRKENRSQDQYRLQPDKRLRLKPALIQLQQKELRRDADEFELGFMEGVIRNDPCHEEALRLLGYLYTANGQFSKGLEVDKRLVRLRPEDATAYYNLACSYSLLGALDDAFASLDQAIDLGYSDYHEMERDPDLAAVRADSRYKHICTKITEQGEPPTPN